MKDRSVNSYDLKEARQILSILAPTTGKVSPPLAKPDAAREGYLRLSAETLGRNAARTTVEPLQDSSYSAGTDELMRPQKFANWENCIAWCMSALRAEAAFVVDSQGFVIASRGRVPGHGFEGTGAELVCSVEQLVRVDPEAGTLLWVDLDFDKRRIVAFVTATEDSGCFVVGLIAPDPHYFLLKQNITRQILDNLPHLE